MDDATLKAPASASPISPEASQPQAGADPILQAMRYRGIPVTRENYLGMAHPEANPEDYPAELEAELPEELRRRG